HHLVIVTLAAHALVRARHDDDVDMVEPEAAPLQVGPDKEPKAIERDGGDLQVVEGEQGALDPGKGRTAAADAARQGRGGSDSLPGQPMDELAWRRGPGHGLRHKALADPARAFAPQLENDARQPAGRLVATRHAHDPTSEAPRRDCGVAVPAPFRPLQPQAARSPRPPSCAALPAAACG